MGAEIHVSCNTHRAHTVNWGGNTENKIEYILAHSFVPP